MRYRALPVEIDAYPWHGNYEDIPKEWWDFGAFAFAPGRVLIIQTTEGPARCLPGLYHAARGTEGEFYPIRNSVMQKKYAAVKS